jgi:uncharacterized beta-barrel protein YwiB (DUF1934 family)
MEGILKKEVRITIKGIQKNEEAEEVMETAAFGEFAIVGSSYYLRYEEISEEGETIKTMIKLSEDRVEVTKKNGVDSKMIFVVGQTTSTDYATPYGTLQMEMETERADFGLVDDCLEVNLEYSLYLNGEFVSINVLHIEAV